MSRAVRVATVSFLSRPQVQENLEAGLRWIDQAGEEGADLILLPEYFLYQGTSDWLDVEGEVFPGPLTGQLARRAARWNMYSILPSIERDDGHRYNTAGVFDRSGEIVGRYRKTHLTRGEIERGIDPGMDLPVFDLDFGRIAILTCFDFWFPEICLVYGLKGADVICLSDMKVGPSLYDILLRLRATAAMTQTYVVQAQYSQEPPYAPYGGRYLTGRACVAGPEGIILADTGHKPGLAVATIDLAEPRITDDCGYEGDRVNFRAALRHFRRPELYGELCRPRREDERIDGATKRALDQAAAEQGLPPVSGAPFWPEQAPTDPVIFP